MTSHFTSRSVASPTPPVITTQHVSTRHHTSHPYDSFDLPRGKYYPSNYKHRVATTVIPIADHTRPLTSSYLEISHKSKNRNKNHTFTPMIKKDHQKPSHDTKTLEVKTKLQQYQREMMAQVRNAVKERCLSSRMRPERVTLHPIDADFDRITPFELGGAETNSYMAEGDRRRFTSRQRIVASNAHMNIDTHKDG